MLWSKFDIEDGKCYRISLCRSEGRRFFGLVPLDVFGDQAFPSRDVKFVTQVVPNELLRRRDLDAISESVLLDNGERFYVDSHCIWWTEKEFSGFVATYDLNQVDWEDGVPPDFPPR